jgi:hypothetical protein
MRRRVEVKRSRRSRLFPFAKSLCAEKATIEFGRPIIDIRLSTSLRWRADRHQPASPHCPKQLLHRAAINKVDLHSNTDNGEVECMQT